ncbi:unnamed protein product [Sphagnum troendelagicum]|uniref:Uncharacterized protein n=1 Tax=Sphagnum troendelagicum TaxID=128251 RepID=A0ABP0UI94_9BRYO
MVSHQEHGAWSGVQRQGQGMVEYINTMAQGLGCMLQSHMPLRPSFSPSLPFPPSLPSFPFPSHSMLSLSLPSPQLAFSSLSSQWPWQNPLPDAHSHGSGNGLGQDAKLGFPVVDWSLDGFESPSIYQLGQEVGYQFGQAGARVGACLGDLTGTVMQHFSGHQPVAHTDGDVSQESMQASSLLPPLCADIVGFSPAMKVEGLQLESQAPSNKGVISPVSTKGMGQGRAEEREETPVDAVASSAHGYDMRGISNEDSVNILTNSQGQQLQKQRSISVSTTFDSRNQDIETSVVARGEVWRAEASHGGASSPLFLVQVGPVLFVRASTLLIPIHLSKRHCLWYGFDRKEGLHSICPAVWSKHRQWLVMSMICLNPITCSFMDLQFPNGQLTYVTREGLTGSAFMPAFGGLLQAQGRIPGETKVSYSCKTKWGTRISPAIQLPDKSVSMEIVQPLAWQQSGIMVRPSLELCVTPMMGARTSGWRAEVNHYPMEKLSWGGGCTHYVETRAFASLSLGRSKRNGEHIGSSGLVVQVETPIDNIRRTSISLQLNSGVEF